MSAFRTTTWRPVPNLPGVVGRLLWPTRYMRDALPYTLDMTAWLADAGDTIVSATASAAPADLACGGVSIAGGSLTLSISGGSPGAYAVTLTMALASGSIDQQVVAIETAYSDVASAPLPWSGLPTSPAGLGPNRYWSNAGEVSITPGSTILPLSPAGLPPGVLWNDGGVVCFSPGVPTSPAGLPSGGRWSNGGVLTLAP